MEDDLFLFIDREEAGEKLAAQLLDEPLIKETDRDKLLVLSIPRGGVVVGAKVAQVLGCAHEVVAARKIGFPGCEEAAIGAMAEDGTIIMDRWMAKEFSQYTVQATRRARRRIKALIHKFRQDRALDLRAKIVIIVDDGIATGDTMEVVMTWLMLKEPAERPGKIIIAVPVCAPGVAQKFEKIASRFICLATPEQFWAVSQFYFNFDQVSDEEVVELLSQRTTVSSPLYRRS
jgi:predicted phosphoribosyltransferase